MEARLIGHVGVDSGQLLLCDPCYIDSEWKKEDFTDVRVYQHRDTNDQLTFGKDFANYEEVIPVYNKTMNELNATGEWEEVQAPDAKYPFSYNACAKESLSKSGYGQLHYSMGHPGVGVVFSTAFGDGIYPVYAIFGKDGTPVKVEVLFQEEYEPLDDFDLDLNDDL